MAKGWSEDDAAATPCLMMATLERRGLPVRILSKIRHSKNVFFMGCLNRMMHRMFQGEVGDTLVDIVKKGMKKNTTLFENFLTEEEVIDKGLLESLLEKSGLRGSTGDTLLEVAVKSGKSSVAEMLTERLGTGEAAALQLIDVPSFSVNCIC